MEVIEITEREIEIIEVIERGPQGPAGVGGVTSVTGAAPIVSSGGTTPAISVTVGTTANTVCAGDDARLSDARTPSSTLSHASTHHTGGTDALAPSDIGAQSIFVVEQLTITTSAQVNLTAARAKIFDIVQYAGTQVDVKLPSTDSQNADTFVFRWATGSDSVRIINSSSPSPVTTVSSGQQVRVIRGIIDSWSVVPVDTHTHTGSQVNVGTTANLPLKTGTNGVVEAGAFGTSAGTFCEGNDARLSDDRDPNLHAASHLPDGADELFDQSLNSADSPTFAKITISGDEINGTAGAIHYRYSSEDPIDNTVTPYFAVESYDQDTEDRVGFAILGVRADEAFIQGLNADFRIEQDGGSLANINMANAVLEDLNSGSAATFDAQSNLTDDRVYTLPDADGTLALIESVAPIDYTVVTTAQTLINGAKVAADTTAGAFTLTLPATPSNGDTITVLDYAASFDTNNLTIARNGSNIESLAENMICEVEDAAFTLVYVGSTVGWKVVPFQGTAIPSVRSDATGITGASDIDNIVTISQANYNALGSYDAGTVYIINDP